MAQQLGHRDAAMTLNVYAHALPDDDEDLAFADFGDDPGRPLDGPWFFGGSSKETAPPRKRATGLGKPGARDGSRTRDPQLGNPIRRTKTT